MEVTEEEMFSGKEFRRKIKIGENCIKTVQQFANYVQNEQTRDLILEYLAAGGSVQELLSLLDVTAKSDLASAFPVFKAINSVIMRVTAGDNEYKWNCKEGVKHMLHSFSPTIQSMVAIKSDKHRKIAFKLLTSIATMDSSFNKDILAILQLTPVQLMEISEPSKGKQTVRKTFIHFIMALLMDFDKGVLKTIMDRKMLTKVIEHLHYDDKDTVILVLTILNEKILHCVLVHKSIKLRIFNTQVLQMLVNLYKWSGPTGVSQINFSIPKKKRRILRPVVSEDRSEVSKAVTAFLVILCTSRKYGVAFWDSSVGTSGTNHNELLATLLQAIPCPWDDEGKTLLVVEILTACPDLFNVTLTRLEPSFLARDSVLWFKVADFIEKLAESTDPCKALSRDATSLSAEQLGVVSRCLSAPLVVVRSLAAGLTDKDRPWAVRHRCCLLLQKLWNKLQQFRQHVSHLGTLSHSQAAHYNTVALHHFSIGLPSAECLLSIWREAVACEKDMESNARELMVLVMVQLLVVVNECRGALDCVEDTNSLVANLLSTMGDSTAEEEQARLALVRLVDCSTLSPHQALFEEVVAVLVKHAAGNEGKACRLLMSSVMLDWSEGEVCVWVTCLLGVQPGTSSIVSTVLVAAIRDALTTSHVAEEDDTADDYVEESVMKGLMDLDVNESEEHVLSGAAHSSIISLSSLLPAALAVAASLQAKKNPVLKEYLTSVAANLFYLYPSRARHLALCCQRNKGTTSSKLVPFLEGTGPQPRPSLLQKEVLNVLRGDGDEDGLGVALMMVQAQELYTCFHFLVSHFSVSSSQLTEGFIEKFLLCFRQLLSRAEGLQGGWTFSSNLTTACVNTVFLNTTLLEAFDPLVGTGVSAVVSRLADLFRRCDQLAVEPWTRRCSTALLNALSHHVKTNSPEHVAAVPHVLNLPQNVVGMLDVFYFTSRDVLVILQAFNSVKDLSLFLCLDEGSCRLSTWCFVLTSFINLGVKCVAVSTLAASVSLLCNIVNHIIGLGAKGVDLTVVDETLHKVLLARVPAIDKNKAFLKAVLDRTDVTAATVRCGRLLLVRSTDQVVSYCLNEISRLQPALVFGLFMSDAVVKTRATQRLLKEFFHLRKIKILAAVGNQEKAVKWILENASLVRNLIAEYLDVLLVSRLAISSNFHPGLLDAVVRRMLRENAMLTHVSSWVEPVLDRVLLELDTGPLQPELRELVFGLTGCQKTNWPGIIDLPQWHKLNLKALKCGMTGDVECIKVLRGLVEVVCPLGVNTSAAKSCYERTISHSEFLPILLRSSPLKDELVKLLLCLLKRDSSCMAESHIPVLLAAYSASLSATDRIILQMLEMYEDHGINISRYEPFLWGSAAVQAYSVRSPVESRLSLWQQVNMQQVLDCLESNRMEATLSHFPVQQGEHGQVYDPAFLLPVFCSLLSPGAVVYCHQFIYKGGLAFTLASLGCRSRHLRAIAALALSKFYHHLQLQLHMKQKEVWLHLLDCLRFSVDDLAVKPPAPLVCIFLARLTLQLSTPLSPMYSPLCDYLLARTSFKLFTLPEFLPLYRSSDVNYREHRRYILRIMRDGVLTEEDVAIMLHSPAFKIMLTYYQSVLCHSDEKVLVMQVLASLLKTPKPGPVVKEYCLVDWTCVVTTRSDLRNMSATLSDALLCYLSLLHQVVTTCKQDTARISLCVAAVRGALRNNTNTSIQHVLDKYKTLLPS